MRLGGYPNSSRQGRPAARISGIGDIRVFTSSGLRAQALAAGLLLAGCTDSPPRMIVDPYLEATGANYIAYGFSHTGTRDGGVLSSFVEADTALIYSDSTLLRGNVTLRAYHEGLGTEKAVVTSDRGRLDMGTDELLAEGNAVLLILEDGRRIESYELHYVPDRDLIRSDSATVMYDRDAIIEGTSFTSDLNFERVVINNGRTRGGAIRF